MTSENTEPHAPTGYALSTDSERIDFEYVHAFLSRESYWAKSITKARLRRAIQHSHCFSVFHDGKQVAFARVITDYGVFAYLCDVFVDPGHRGHGVGKWLVRSIVEHPELGQLRRWILGTRDAHGLYAKNGFTPLKNPEIFMEKFDPEVYAREVGER
jgi:GNAT superfamily N-acetyltransferase